MTMPATPPAEQGTPANIGELIGQYGMQVATTGELAPTTEFAAAIAATMNPKLDDIEQYRMQMAGISTAAMGYWKTGDSIHSDYDTLPLRDVANLYAKYDALFKIVHNPKNVCEHGNGLVEYCHPCGRINQGPK